MHDCVFLFLFLSRSTLFYVILVAARLGIASYCRPSENSARTSEQFFLPALPTKNSTGEFGEDLCFVWIDWY